MTGCSITGVSCQRKNNSPRLASHKASAAELGRPDLLVAQTADGLAGLTILHGGVLLHTIMSNPRTASHRASTPFARRMCASRSNRGETRLPAPRCAPGWAGPLCCNSGTRSSRQPCGPAQHTFRQERPASCDSTPHAQSRPARWTWHQRQQSPARSTGTFQSLRKTSVRKRDPCGAAYSTKTSVRDQCSTKTSVSNGTHEAQRATSFFEKKEEEKTRRPLQRPCRVATVHYRTGAQPLSGTAKERGT